MRSFITDHTSKLQSAFLSVPQSTFRHYHHQANFDNNGSMAHYLLCVTPKWMCLLFIVFYCLFFHRQICSHLWSYASLCGWVTVIITLAVLPQRMVFVFAPQWSDTAVSSISLPAIMQHQKGQIVPPNLLLVKKTVTVNHAFGSMNK